MIKKFLISGLGISVILILESCKQQSNFSGKTRTNPTGERDYSSSTSQFPNDQQPPNQAQIAPQTPQALAKKASTPRPRNPEKPSPTQLAAACNGSATIKHLSLTKTFPEPSQSCDWNNSTGNLGQKNGRISARYEETKFLGLPKNALLCSMSIKFTDQNNNQNQDMYYDDEIFILFDDLILASSKNYGSRLQKSVSGFQIYDWSQLVSTNYDSNGLSRYCADGDSSCQIPKTQTKGMMSLTVSDSTIQKMALDAGLKVSGTTSSTQSTSTGDHSIGFVTIGDNDNPIDCKHSALSFQLEADYVVVASSSTPATTK